MAVTLNANTSTGFIATSDASGILQLQTAGTTAVTISAAQVVTLTNALPVASGGTGVTTSTGSGANVLATSPTITTPTLTSPIITGSIPQITTYTSGSGTYTVPTNARYLVVEMVGGGGGGSGSGNLNGPYGGDGTTGGNSTFGTSTANGGGPGSAAGGGSISGTGGGYTVGGTSGVGITGGRGWGATLLASSEIAGLAGGSTPFGCAGGLGTSSSANTATGTANTGGGGMGGFAQINDYPGTGGGGGGYVKAIYASPSATYSYAVGAGGAGGAKATGCCFGETGSAGLIVVTAFF